MPFHLNKQWVNIQLQFCSCGVWSTSHLTFHKDHKHYNRYFGGFKQVFGGFPMLFLLCHIASLNAKLNVNEENGKMTVTYLKHTVFRTLNIDSLNCNKIIGNGLYGVSSLELHLKLRGQRLSILHLFRITMHKALF